MSKELEIKIEDGATLTLYSSKGYSNYPVEIQIDYPDVGVVCYLTKEQALKLSTALAFVLLKDEG